MATMEIFKKFGFEAAHYLPRVEKGHKCGVTHGHHYQVTVFINGTVGSDSGWLRDFAEIDTAFRPLLEQLDHQLLNEVEGLPNPTSECLAVWVWERLSQRLPGLSQVMVQETENSGCIYRGQQS